ncbi:MAG: hypothetical protein IH631_10505, partial [Candidatus Thorarchaeota archaeon]|nr:hypothetical protein [Candidatus Thorarchaeota archaeon]
MLPYVAPSLLAQIPFEFAPPDYWFPVLTQILNVFYALSIRGYLIFILIGFIVYATTYIDGFGKFMVAAGFFLYFVGPLVVNVFAYFATVELVT